MKVLVESDKSKDEYSIVSYYTVDFNEEIEFDPDATCTCKAFVLRIRRPCKHIAKVFNTLYGEKT